MSTRQRALKGNLLMRDSQGENWKTRFLPMRRLSVDQGNQNGGLPSGRQPRPPIQGRKKEKRAVVTVL